MKKTFLSIGALSTAAALSIAPVSAEAASRNVQVHRGNGYTVIRGQNMTDIRDTLKELGILDETGKLTCPSYPNTEDVTPEKPEIPNTPEEETPDTSLPDTPSPEIPDTELPGDTDQPVIPETPENPGNPNRPGDSEESEDVEMSAEAAEVVRIVNEERARAGLPALKADAKVTAAANVRAKEIAKKFSHTRPDGSKFSTALKEQGITYRMSGENIAWGQKTPQNVMDAWMTSDGHRANILEKEFQNIGVGYYRDEKGVNHWVQLFTK